MLGRGMKIEAKGGQGYFTYGVKGIPLMRAHLSKGLTNLRKEYSLYVSFMWIALFVTRHYYCFPLCIFLNLPNRFLRS